MLMCCIYSYYRHFDQHLVTSMKFCQLFDIFQNENNHSDERFITFNQFYTYLRCKDKTVKNSKIRRALQSNGGGIQEINGNEYVTVKSVLKYSFNNEKSEACRYIADVVQREISKYNKATTLVSSSHDLYYTANGRSPERSRCSTHHGVTSLENSSFRQIFFTSG